MKDRRQRAILTLVATRPVHSQEELVALLERQGYEVTQATVSRDIKELGLVKVPITGRRRRPSNTSFRARPSTTSAVCTVSWPSSTTIDASVNQIVINTGPGSAMMVASAIDEAAWPEVLGTIGGDDTILVIVQSAEQMPVDRTTLFDLRKHTLHEPHRPRLFGRPRHVGIAQTAHSRRRATSSQ